MKVPGDTKTFESFMAANKEQVLELTERSKAEGCLAHRFAVGDGYVLVVDEWESAEKFQGFISAPDLQEAMGQMGAQGEPEILFAEAKGFPGEF
jgi:hypothetical protein